MLKNRWFWNGIGMGLIAGAFLLQVMILGADNAAQEVQTQAWSVERLETEAERLGYRLIDTKQTLYTQDELDKALLEQQPETNEDVETIRSVETVRSFIILPGMTSEQIADILLQLQIIKDQERFKEALSKSDLHTKIQAGLYYFDETPLTIDEVIQKLTD